jgi:SAM-dependent methyltransferase
VSEALLRRPGYTFHLGDILETFPKVPDDSFDLIVFLSILEHLDDPALILREARRALRPGGRLFFNSPTWFGKWVLENISCTRLIDPYGEITKQINTHKMYYSLKDMWPLLVKAGFVSTEIRIWRSNFFCSISGYAEK